MSDELYPDDSGEEPPAIKEIRDALKRKEKEVKDRDKEIAELRSFKEDQERAQRSVAVGKAFEEAGLKSKWAPLFLKERPDAEPTAEAISKFAEDFDLSPSQPESLTQSGPGVTVSTPFVPTVVGEPPGGQRITRSELNKLQFSGDPTKRAQAMAWQTKPHLVDWSA